MTSVNLTETEQLIATIVSTDLLKILMRNLAYQTQKKESWCGVVYHQMDSLVLTFSMKQWHSEKNKGGLKNPPKRFCRFLKGSKCFQGLKKRIKNSTEHFEGSAFYSIAEPFLTEPFLKFCTAKKGFVRKYETLKVLWKTITVQYGTIRVTYQWLMVLYRTLKLSYFLRKPFFAVQNFKKGSVRNSSAIE